ncbi:MAG TPA: tetratricopeptide repeat protein [Rectinema sp.]|nr:tetratricopeptide repeat protein [Rectinema sp.]
MNSRELNDRGVDLIEEGRVEEALECFDKAIELDPQAIFSRINRANALALLDRIDEAIGEFAAALRIDEENTSLWYNRGIVMSQIGDEEEAERCYRRAIQINPQDEDSSSSYNNLAVCLINRGKLEEAIQYLEKAVQLDPQNKSASSNLRVVHRLLGDKDKSGEC